MGILRFRKQELYKYRGACWGMLIGGPLGMASCIGMQLSEPSLIALSLTSFWIGGAICGDSMQTLLEVH